MQYRQYTDALVVRAIEDLIHREEEQRVALEAAGTGAALGSELAQARLFNYIWDNDDLPELRMEAVFILTELGNCFARDQLTRIASDPRFGGDEIRQAAVWGLGKAGLKTYEDLLPFIGDEDEGVAVHAICAFDSDTPSDVLDHLVHDLVSGDERRAPAASLALRNIASERAVQALALVAGTARPVPKWIMATLGLMPEASVRRHVTNPYLLECVSPMFLLSESSNWLSSETTVGDVSFLVKQDVW